MWVKELIENLPELVRFIAPGFLLVTCFTWATKQLIKNTTTYIVISTVASYLIWAFCNLFIDEESVGTTIIICSTSLILGIVTAIIYKTTGFNNFIAKIGIKRTTNPNIWDDVVGERAWVSIYDKENKQYYCGPFKFQNYQDEYSYVVLCKYYITDEKGNIINDYTKTNNRFLMLQINNYDRIVVSKDDPFGHFKME